MWKGNVGMIDGFSVAHHVRRDGLLLLAAFLVLAPGTAARAYTPDDPEVKAMIDKGVAYLIQAKGDEYAESLGGKCLVAMATYKHLEDKNHPKVLEAVAACQQQINASPQSLPGDFNYSLGLAIIFLCEIDAQQYSSEIQWLLGLLHSRQRSDGAWSYPDYQTGDTSQTQYAALAMWMAHTHGYPAPPEAVENYANWLIRVQDVSGAFPYQGKDPGGYQRIEQDRGEQGLRLSMSPAALGSLYIAADILKIPFVRSEQSPEEEVFQKVGDAAPRPKTLSPDRLKEAIRHGISFYDRQFAIDIGRNQHYYLYSLERYQSFREHVEKKREAEPAWYNAGVNFLKSTQAEDGSWQGTRGKTIDTAFSVLFLLRGTQRAIREVSDGRLIGGRELPTDLTKIQLKGGTVVDTEFRGDIGSLLDLIESGESIDAEAMIAQLDQVQFDTSKEKDRTAFERLQKMVSGSNYQARMLAVRSLANSGDLENVPVLIYALSDPDNRVAREANEGLRLLSRRFSAAPLPEAPTLEQKRAAQYAWRDWLKTVRPDLEIPPDVFTAGEPDEANGK